MAGDMDREAGRGLERSCEGAAAARIRDAPPVPGLERIEASFCGRIYAAHRHDTYGLGVTLEGVQTFSYRGEQHYSTAGRVIVLHPDELHDGAAGTAAGLRYRMLYLEPALLQRASRRPQGSLPFVARPVVDDPALRAVLLAALGDLDAGLDELHVDDLVGRIADGLRRHSDAPATPLAPTAWRAAERARDFLAANALRTVRSSELEEVTDLDRFTLARHFRSAFGTSPHRFQTMRRLERGRVMIGAGSALADVAAAMGFADQSHMTRMFKRAYGVPPGRWAALAAASREAAAPAPGRLP